jgi:hypothetical protein
MVPPEMEEPAQSFLAILSRVGLDCVSDVSSAWAGSAQTAGPAEAALMSDCKEGEAAVDCAIVGESGGAGPQGEVTSGWTKRYYFLTCWQLKKIYGTFIAYIYFWETLLYRLFGNKISKVEKN